MATCEHGADDITWAVDDADDPIDFFMWREIPGAASGVALAGEVSREERRGVHAIEHFVALRPGFSGEEAGGFAEAVADDGVGLEGEGGEKVADERAEGDLSEDGVAGRDLVGEVVGPVAACGELGGKTGIFGVLLVEDLRELSGEVAAHHGELIAGAGEDEGDFTSGGERRGCVENAIRGKRFVLFDRYASLGNQTTELRNGIDDEGDGGIASLRSVVFEPSMG